jgi:hypothetical protein
MRIGGQAPRRRAHSLGTASKPCLPRVTATSDCFGYRICQLDKGTQSRLFSRSASYAAGRRTTPSGTSPVVTSRQSAISSLRARATIIALRVPRRPSSVRFWYH